MEQGLSNALSIMAVGMITVFFILWLVVLIGNVLIRITNKYWPEPDDANKPIAVSPDSDSTLAAIVAAVDTLTQGRGKVTNITKV